MQPTRLASSPVPSLPRYLSKRSICTEHDQQWSALSQAWLACSPPHPQPLIHLTMPHSRLDAFSVCIGIPSSLRLLGQKNDPLELLLNRRFHEMRAATLLAREHLFDQCEEFLKHERFSDAGGPELLKQG